jgi:hypothetical protein
MGLETGTTIASFISSNPTSADPVNEGDNHLRLIKSVLKAQFPGAAALGYNIPITATEAELNSLHTGSITTILPTISGYVIGANTAIASTDTLLASIGKAQGQINAKTVITGSELVTNLQDVNGLNVTSGIIESAGRFTLSAVYTIQTIGTTTNTQWNTIANTTNVTATALVAGRTYVIVSPGTTDFTLIGAANNTIGTSFIATGAGTGSGTALRTYTVNSTFTCANIGTSMGTGTAFRETNTTAQRETATTFDIGGIYTIQSIGTTNFTLIGAASNTVGLVFTATGVGAGTGTALRKMSMGLSGSITALTGVVTALTANAGTNTAQIATTANVYESSIGWGQTWQDVTASRNMGTSYTNSTGKPIFLSFESDSTTGTTVATVNGVVAARAFATAGVTAAQIYLIIPPSATYVLTGGNKLYWAELR